VKESELKRRLVRMVNLTPRGYAIRCEDRFAVGRLDMILKLPGLPVVWAEGKLVTGNLFAPSPRQFLEGHEIEEAGMRAVLIGWKGVDMYVSPWVEKADIRTAFTTPEHRWDYPLVLREYLAMTGM